MFQLDRIRFRVFAQRTLPKLIRKIWVRTAAMLWAAKLIEISSGRASRGECRWVCEEERRNRGEHACRAPRSHSAAEETFCEAGPHTGNAPVIKTENVTDSCVVVYRIDSHEICCR